MKIKNLLIFLSLMICILIVFHHYIKHINDFHLTDHEKIFQISDVSNHESFVFLFTTIGLPIIFVMPAWPHKRHSSLVSENE